MRNSTEGRQNTQALLFASASILLLTMGQASSAAPGDSRKQQSWEIGGADSLIKGNKPLAAWSREGEECFEYPLYTVFEKSGEFLDMSISTFPARVKCKNIDQSSTIAPIFQIRKSSEFFAGLIGSRLITDTGTGTDGRILTIYDVKSRSKLRAVADYYGDLELKDGTLLYFWVTSTHTRAAPQNCAIYKRNAADMLGTAIEMHVFVDLEDNKMHMTSRLRCNTRQTARR